MTDLINSFQKNKNKQKIKEMFHDLVNKKCVIPTVVGTICPCAIEALSVLLLDGVLPLPPTPRSV